MVAENGKGNDVSAESPTSVLEDEEKCKEEITKLEEETVLDAKNGDTSLLSEAMVEEEEKLREARLKEEINQGEPEESVHLNDTQFTRLDELLTQTQMYSEFLLEKMEDITFSVPKPEAAQTKRGRGSKRRAANQYNNVFFLLYLPCQHGIVVVTSYEMAMNDAKKFLRHYEWKYVVVDEGHRLKNFQCKLVKELKHLRAGNKLLLTGTPLQNNLAELWSLLNFILPDIFQSHEEFESWFDFSGKSNGEVSKEEMEEKRRAQVVAKLHAILRPFLLRRMKSDVEQMLPRKKEIILYASLTEYQRNFQDHLLNKTLESHLRDRGDSGCGMKGKLNNLMIQLRKNCNHPDLLEAAFDGSYFYPPVEQIVEQCGKFQLLERCLLLLPAFHQQVLIFSQWTKVLDIMDYYFSEKGFNVCRIDGSVKLEERRRQIQEFNDVNSDYRIFILSTRAGGLGINLTAADTCILYDSDWNPQMDLQAMDRCHRIGQTKPVHVYRLATAQSVECRILKRAYSKLKLEHVVIGKGQFHQERKQSNDLVEEEDLLALLRDEETAEDKMIQTDISDEDLERILDRSDLIADTSDKEKAQASADAVPLKGPGWEVVLPTGTGGMLSTLNS
ncbi:hypothetical protein GOBAR_DD00778 [Gossypium barbadense]|nr:hypothetical protein GOBAR_DD00778 [Gossypium barbadense]